MKIKLNWWETYVLSHLFGSNWEANLLNAFRIAAIAQFTGTGSLSQTAIESWAEQHVATLADDIARHNPMYAALLTGVAEQFVPAIVSAIYADVEKAVGVTDPNAPTSGFTGSLPDGATEQVAV